MATCVEGCYSSRRFCCFFFFSCIVSLRDFPDSTPTSNVVGCLLHLEKKKIILCVCQNVHLGKYHFCLFLRKKLHFLYIFINGHRCEMMNWQSRLSVAKGKS